MRSLPWASEIIHILSLAIVPEFIWMSAAGELHCFKLHTHISNTSSCSCHQPAAAPSSGVAPGMCSWELNPFEAG